MEMELANSQKEIDSLTSQYGDLDQFDQFTYPLELQSMIENVGGERIKAQKLKVNKIQLLIDQHKDVLDRAKHDYEQLKKTVDELRASDQNVELVKELKLRIKKLEGVVGESTKDSDVSKR
ncbi:unnamed protein product [Ilex paraguariensis]|uniref:Uncharacterized protein n=1 Tax=Ilex paraguariensis TaxID=185542 RepID=A0ABC8QTR6_9AQUA